MAKTTLQLYYDTGGVSTTIYAIIRRVSDGYVWDVADESFGAWSDGSIGSYDLPLADSGGDLFTVAVPTAIPSGTVIRVGIYVQAGGSPATTDYLVSSSEWTWNGSGLQSPTISDGTSSSVTISSTALTTLAGVKRQLGIAGSENDTHLTELINAASAKIERMTGRLFAARNQTEWFDAWGGESVNVTNWPIVYVRGVSGSIQTAINVTYSGSDVTATIHVGGTSMRLATMAADGTETATSLTLATYPTFSTLATAISAVPGWTATRTGDGPSRWLRPRFYDLNGSAAYIEAADNVYAPAAYTASGIVTLDPGGYEATPVGFGGYRGGYTPVGTHAVMVDYRGGYETIPADIDQLCRDMVQQIWGMVSKDTSLQSESLGSYSYSLADSVTLNDGQAKTLAIYSREVIA